MRIVKIYETIINLTAVELFTNIDATVMDKLRKRYEGVCYKSSLIMKILEITKRDPPKLAISRLDGSGDVNVQFTAEAIVYQEGDILVGCEVVRVERNNRIICKYANAVINLRGNRNLQSLKPGQLITVLVEGTHYTINHDKITITALPYAYPSKFTIYFTTLNPKNISFEQLQLIKDKLNDIDEEYKKYSQAPTRIVKVLNETYYPYKTPFSAKQKLDKYLGLDDIYEIASQLVKSDKKTATTEIGLARHPFIDKSTPHVLTVGTELLANPSSSDLLNAETYAITAVKEAPGTVVLTLLDDYLGYLRMVREAAELYQTEKLWNEHSNIWRIYDSMKR